MTVLSPASVVLKLPVSRLFPFSRSTPLNYPSYTGVFCVSLPALLYWMGSAARVAVVSKQHATTAAGRCGDDNVRSAATTPAVVRIADVSA